MRAESPMMRRLRQLDLDARQLRAVDLLALAVGYGVLLAVLVATAISIIDWLDGRPDSVIPAIAAALDALDGWRP